MTRYNGLNYMIMDSGERADIMIDRFKGLLDCGQNPNDPDLQKELYDDLGYDFDSLLSYDQTRVLREVERYARFNY